MCIMTYRSIWAIIIKCSLQNHQIAWQNEPLCLKIASRAELFFTGQRIYLTLILLTWTIWRAPTNASKWRMGFNSAFKGLKAVRFQSYKESLCSMLVEVLQWKQVAFFLLQNNVLLTWNIPLSLLPFRFGLLLADVSRLLSR